MHEWALAEAVAHAIKEEVDRCGLRAVTMVTLRIGELQMIDLEIFLSALRETSLIYGLPLDMQNVKIEKEPGLFRCRTCGQRFGLERVREMGFEEVESVHFLPEIVHAFIKCPSCNSRDFEFQGGRGIFLESIEGET